MKSDDNERIAMLEERLAINTKIVEENNELLRKMRRSATISMWVGIVWYVTIIGLPFALYFYVLEPYFDALGSDFEVFQAGMNELPGFKNINALLDGASNESTP